MPHKTKRKKKLSDIRRKTEKTGNELTHDHTEGKTAIFVISDLKKTILISMALFTLEILIFYAMLKKP